MAEWIFNADKPCPQIEDASGGTEKCLAVKGIELNGGGALLLVWISCLLILTRIVLRGQSGLYSIVVEVHDDDEDEEVEEGDRSSALSNLTPGWARISSSSKTSM